MVFKKIKFFFYLFYPIEILYLIIIYLRKIFYKYNILKTYKFNLPIIVVGNLTVGGTGKTPMVAYLANYFESKGLKVAIIMRGYKGKYLNFNSIVKKNFSPDHYGDEAIMLANQLNCPIMVGKNRVKSVKYLLENYKLDLIISDDGLQHYKLGRDIEIVMIDADRYFGNQHLLPLGPLRTSINELKHADFIMLNTNFSNLNYNIDKNLNHNLLQQIINKIYNIQLIAKDFNNLFISNLNKNATYFSSFSKVHAVAGIGNNQKFFNLLNSLNIRTINHGFPDHYNYKFQDLDFKDDLPIIMTEKDAIKCTSFANAKFWQLKVNLEIEFEKKFQDNLLKSIQKKLNINDFSKNIN